MAFALTGFKAFGIRTNGAVRQKAMQVAELIITGTAADVALDIGNDSGTFWTAALADATYGTLATAAQTVLKNIVSQSKDIVEVEAAALLKRVPIGALTGNGQYTLTLQNTRPNITLNAGDGDTAYTIAIRWVLKDGIEPVTSDLGAAI